MVVVDLRETPPESPFFEHLTFAITQSRRKSLNCQIARFRELGASHGSSISDIHPPSNSSSRTIRMFFTAFMIAR
jgi:hypothetical protein